MQILANGLVQGLTISLLALAFALVYLPVRVFHLALGAVYAATPYLVLSAARGGLPEAGAVVVALGAAAALSAACEAGNHWPLERRGAASTTHMISSLGLYIVMVQLIALLWGNETRVLRAGVDVEWSAAGVDLTRSQLVAAGVSALLIVVTQVWLHASGAGLRLRAMASNPSEFALRGFNVRRTRVCAFAFSGVLASASALLVALDVGFSPMNGLPMLLAAIVAVFVGAGRSFIGVVASGVAIGVLRTEVTWHLSVRWQEAVTYLLLLSVLVARPWSPAAGQQDLRSVP